MHDPAWVDTLTARADEILGGQTRALGTVVHRPADSVGIDPITGYAWPATHGKRVDFRSAPANPKWIWELERCQDLQVLTAAWLLSEDGRYAEAAASAFERWVATHPPGRGIAWPNGFEAGVRAISLALSFDALSATASLSRRLHAAGLGTLWQHGRWIERDPSTHSSANNHRIGELVGLLAIARLAPELPEAPSWAARSLAGLRVEAERQILPDGTGAEQSYAYTLFVLDLLLVATALLDATSLETPHEILDALQRAAHGLWAQVAPGEPEPDYGDRDDGRALRMGGDDARGTAEVAAALCARLGSPYARALAASPDPTALWLFGREGADRFAQTAPSDHPGSILLEDSGIAVLRRGGTRVTVDAGPLGYLSLAAHGHADALSVTVSSGGSQLVVDPGTGTYFGRQADVRDAFRGTGFHATVVVDDADQSASGGPFLWLRHARSRFSRVDPAELVAAGEHDGYEALPDPVRHRRVVHVLETDIILVYDRLDARSRHAAAVRWPLSRELIVRLEGLSHACADADGEEVLRVLVAGTAPGALELAHGSETPFAGWVSPHLEEVVPAPLVSWRTTFTGRTDIATLLILRPGDDVRRELSIRTEAEHAEIVVFDGSEKLALRVDASGELSKAYPAS